MYGTWIFYGICYLSGAECVCDVCAWMSWFDDDGEGVELPVLCLSLSLAACLGSKSPICENEEARVSLLRFLR